MEFDQRLISLIIGGNNEEAKSMIEKCNLYRKTDFHGRTLLHHTIAYGNLAIVQYLLDKNCDINAQDALGYTPLTEALKGQYERVTEALLKAGADVLLLDNKNKSSLHIFLAMHSPFSPIFKVLRDQFRQRFTSEEAAKQLFHAGFRLDEVLHLRDAEIIENMFKQGYQCNFSEARAPPKIGYNIPLTVLHLAVLLCDLDSIKVLLKYGANANVQNPSGINPLFFVYFENKKDPNHVEILKILLNAGASPLPYIPYILPISTVLQHGSREAIKVLFDAKIDFNVQDSFGRTALHYLAMNMNNRGIIEELKLHMAKLNMSLLDRAGGCPLREAAMRANVPMLQFLLKYSAGINAFNNVHNYPPLFAAYLNPNTDFEDLADQCVEILLQHNAGPQFVLVLIGTPTTVFDIEVSETMNSEIDRLKPVIAQLALIEKLGTVIVDIIKAKIDSQAPFKEYFEKCRQMLKKKISGNVTVFQLLTADEKTMAKYLNKYKLLQKLTCMKYKQKLILNYPYYYKILKNRLSKGYLYKTLFDKATLIIDKLMEYRFGETNIIIEKIISYLDENHLRQLHKM